MTEEQERVEQERQQALRDSDGFCDGRKCAHQEVKKAFFTVRSSHAERAAE